MEGPDWAPLYRERSLAASRAASMEAGAKRSFWSNRGSERSLRFWASVTEGNICVKDSLLFADTKAVDDANAAATFSAPLEKDRWNWSSRGSSMGQQPESPRKRKRAVTVHNWKL